MALEKAKSLSSGKDVLTIEDIEGLLIAAKAGKTPSSYINPILGSIKTGAPIFP